jgi:hypothetical protein
VKIVELPPDLRKLDGFGGAPLIQLDSSGTVVARPTLPSRAWSDKRVVFCLPREGYWKTIEENFHWHMEILPQLIGLTGFERASWFFYNPVPPETAARCLSC